MKKFVCLPVPPLACIPPGHRMKKSLIERNLPLSYKLGFDGLLTYLRPQGAYILLLLEEGVTRFARDGWWRGPGSFYLGAA